MRPCNLVDKKIRTMKPWKTFAYVLGAFAFATLVALASYWNLLFEIIMRKEFHLSPSSTLYQNWVRNTIPIYLEVYLYNWTNAHEFVKNKSIIPNFKEVGPYLFEETRQKLNMTWNRDQETVTFNQSRTWRLLEDVSENFEEKVTNLNPVASSIAYISRLWESKLQRKIANTLLNIHEPFITTGTAGEWLFKGLEDEFLGMFEQLRKVTEISIPYNKFGWFYDRNRSSSFDGVFTMKTGNSDRKSLGSLIGWNLKNKTEHYEGDCSLVLGYTGEIMPPLKPSQKKLTVFASDICSYITLKFAKTVEFKGLDAYEFVGDASVFDNGTLYPENSCFYTAGETCLSGVRNVSSCRFGSPAFISFPHFYSADPEYRENISGMSPDKFKHKFRLLVEPKSGIPLSVDASFQINFLVEPYKWCDQFRDLRRMFIPMLWFKQSVEIPDYYVFLLKAASFAQSNGGIFLFALGFLIGISILLSLVFKQFKIKSNQ